MGQNTSSQHHGPANDRYGIPDDPETSHEFRLPYVLQATLGKGTNGVVYVAELTTDQLPQSGGRNIVVKKIPLSQKKKRAKRQTAELRDEIETVVNLEHGNLVKYFGWNLESPNEDVTDQQHIAYFRVFMEYCSGGTLQQRARKGFRYHQLRECTRQILEGLVYLHGRGIAHGDLNTTSIFLTDRSQLHLKIGGFGRQQSLTMTDRKSSENDPRTSPAYNAPETRVRRKPSVVAAVTHKDDQKTDKLKADIWSVAFCLIELLHEGEREEPDSAAELLELIGGSSLDPIISWFLGVDGLLGSTYLTYFAHNRKVIECIKFLRACLQRNPAARPSAGELLGSAHVSEHLDEKEVRPEEDILRQFTVTGHLTDCLFQVLDTATGEKVILTKRVVELANWMDEFVSIATVVAFNGHLEVKAPHPQMIRRTHCWACREAPSAAFVEQMTVYSRWDLKTSCILLEKLISSRLGPLALERTQDFTSQIIAILQSIWDGIRSCPLGGNLVVLDLCTAYLLVNEARSQIFVLPFLFPEVMTDNDHRNCFIAANIWDLGIIVLCMLTGKTGHENREAGSFQPVIPDMLDEKAVDFLQHCFACFQPHDDKAVNWIRTPGELVWPVDMMLRHPFLDLQTKILY